MARTRLTPEHRREQLLDTGAALFAERLYDDVFVEDIVARARVSRATFYHYFGSKRELYIAILKRATSRSLAHVDPDPQLPLAELLAVGIDDYIQSFVDHPVEAVAINCGALSDDPAIQAIISDELNVVGQRVVDQLVEVGCLRDAMVIAVEGWLAFVRAACVKWIQSQNISRGELAEMCLHAVEGVLGSQSAACVAEYAAYISSGGHLPVLTAGAGESAPGARRIDRIMTTRMRHNPGHIVRKLTPADRQLAEGKQAAVVCCELGVSEAADRLKELERENATLKRLLVDSELEKDALRDIAKVRTI